MTPRRIGIRQALWQRMRARKGAAFTVREIALKGDGDPVVQARTYLAALCHAGIVARSAARVRLAAGKRGNTKIVRYRVVRDVGIEAPRLRRDGSSSASLDGRRPQMWTAMKILGEFTALDIAIWSGVDHPISLKSASKYCRVLQRAGYLHVVAAGRSGHVAKHTVYRLVKARDGALPKLRHGSQA